MSDLTRRTFLGTMAVAAGTSALPKSMERGDLSFQNNVPDSLLSGKELPISKRNSRAVVDLEGDRKRWYQAQSDADWI